MLRFIHLLFFLPGTLFSQRKIKSYLDAEMANYYHAIHLAARAVYVNDFAAASAHYQEAFRHKAIPFYTDLKNAILVNSKCGLQDKNNALLQILFEQKGMDSIQLFQAFPKRIFNDQNLAFIRKQKPVRDAAWKDRQLYQQAFYNIWNTDQDEVVRDPVAVRFAGAEFMELYHKKGFPTEERLGCFTPEGSEIWWRMTTLMTNFLKDKQLKQDEVIQILETEFRKGNIPATVFGTCYSQFSGVTTQVFLSELVTMTNKKIYRPFIHYSDSTMRIINTTRLAMGLDSFHVAQRQYICGNYCDIPECTDPLKSTIQTEAYIHNSDIPYWFVKAAFEKEKADLNWYEINTRAAAFQCDCQLKQY